MKDTAKRVTGGCLCGNVRYEAQVFLKSAYYCHCRICLKEQWTTFADHSADQGGHVGFHES